MEDNKMNINPTEQETTLLKERYAQFLLSIPETYISKFSPESAILFADMFVKKVKYGVKYDENSEKIMAYIASIMG